MKLKLATAALAALLIGGVAVGTAALADDTTTKTDTGDGTGGGSGQTTGDDGTGGGSGKQ